MEVYGKTNLYIGHYKGLNSSGQYTNIPAQLESFISYFDKLKMSDNDRIIFFKEALVCMKKEKQSDVEDPLLEDLLKELKEKLSGKK